MAEVTLSFPKSPQVKPSTLKFIVAPPLPPPFIEQRGTLTGADGSYAHRKGSHFQRYPIEFKAGVTYVIELKSAYDTYLFLEDADKNVLQRNDDGGPGLNSRIAFRPTKTATYNIIATSYGRGRTGAFRLQVREQR